MTDALAMNNKPAGLEYSPHPCTELFPSMNPEQEADFVADIERNGLREPIIIDEHDRIVDGVHRYRACIKLGIEPSIERRNLTAEEAWALSISRNLARRHLGEAARAAISAEVRGSANLPVTQAEVAKAFNISERTQRSAEAVLAASPDLHRAVKNDELSVHAAEQITKLPAAERDAAIDKVNQGDVKGARALAKAARPDANKKSKDGGKIGKKTIAKDLASAEVKTPPAAEKARPAKKARKQRDEKSLLHADYGRIFPLLDEVYDELALLPGYLKSYPLAPEHAQDLLAKLHNVHERTATAMTAVDSR